MFLSSDGASTNFIVVGDPIKTESRYKKQTNDRILCPVVTNEGFMLFVTGKRTARKLASLEDRFADHVINVTRHGPENDPDATYEVTALQDAATFKSLKALAAKTFTKEALAEAIDEAKEVLTRS